MNGLIQIVGSQLRRKARDAAVRGWNEVEQVLPIQPPQDLHLKSAKRALAIVEHKMGRHAFNVMHHRVTFQHRYTQKKVRLTAAVSALCFSPS